MTRLTCYELVILAHQANTIRQYAAYAVLVRSIAAVVPALWRDPLPRPVGGHYGVTRSLTAGLEQLGVRFAYAPRLESTTARAAIVLGGVDELKAAMAWRRGGGCGLLLAGPNVAELPHDQDGILLSPDIDRVVVASERVRQNYLSIAPELAGRVWVWPAGVDETYWHRQDASPRKIVLIYNKRMPELAAQLFSALNARGFACEVIHYSGQRKSRYRLHQFRSALARAGVCVMLTLDEPQGLAAAEAWSMDVPTLAYRAPGYEGVGTVPYLTAETGSYWSSIDDLIVQLRGAPAAGFTPRRWVLANMTDAVCAAQLMALVRSHAAPE
jgi:hypothetical protein